jgi:heterodisulfide reductase subunit A
MEKIIPRIGLFICDQGGRLARTLDLPGLAAKISKLKSVVRCEVVQDPWAAPFLDSLTKDLESGRIDRLLWDGRFTPSQTARIQDRFAAALNPFLLDWCSLEDQGVLTDGIQPAARQRKALTLLQMAADRTRLLEPLKPLEVPASDAALVIGAGVAGLHAAAALIERGKRVFLIEKETAQAASRLAVAVLSPFMRSALRT